MRKHCIKFPLIHHLANIPGPFYLFPLAKHLCLPLSKHVLKGFFFEPSVAILKEDVLSVKARGLYPFLLLPGGVSETDQGYGKYIPGKVKQGLVRFIVFHDIPYVARADTQ